MADLECEKGFVRELHQIHVEGHTDNVPFRPRNGIRDNIDLSLLRAASVKTILELGLSNANRHAKVIFVPVGYGSSKPVIFYDHPVDEPKNRRIDFRFSLQKGWEHSRERNHD